MSTTATKITKTKLNLSGAEVTYIKIYASTSNWEEYEQLFTTVIDDLKKQYKKWLYLGYKRSETNGYIGYFIAASYKLTKKEKILAEFYAAND